MKLRHTLTGFALAAALVATAAPPAGQREIDPQAQPAPDYEFDQRVTW